MLQALFKSATQTPALHAADLRCICHCVQADLRGFTAKVSDFGLSKLVADSVGGVTIPEDTSKASGTVTHMAPELLANGRASPAADVYAFGILSKHFPTRCAQWVLLGESTDSVLSELNISASCLS